MSFKWLARAATAICMALPGCGLKTGEEPPSQEPPSFSGQGYSCVGQIPDHMSRYFKDDLSESQITDFVRCLQKSFTSFAQLTRGREVSVYSSEEIRHFLQGYFFRERLLSPALMHEFMVIKQVLIGGRVDQITRRELAAIVEVLEDVRQEALRLKPFLRVLNPKLAVQESPINFGDRLNEANEALNQTIQKFSVRLRSGGRGYSYASLTKFLTEFRAFVNWERHIENSRPVAAWVGMLKAFKAVTVSGVDTQEVRPNEWTDLLRMMSRWYFCYLQYQVGVRDRTEKSIDPRTGREREVLLERRPILNGEGLQNLIYLGREVFRLAEEARGRQQPSGVITYSQLTALAESAQALGWLNPNVRISGLQSGLEAAFSRIFKQHARASPGQRRIDGLKGETLSIMKADFERWIDIQLRIDRLYPRARTRSTTIPQLRPKLVPLGIQNRLAELSDSDWDDFIKIKSKPKPLMRPLYSEESGPPELDDLSSVMLVPEADFERYGLRYEFLNLSRMNLLRSIVTLVFRGYAENGGAADWNSGIKSAEMQQFYMDFRAIGVDLGFIDSRNENAGARSFVEGNLFMYSADGLKQGSGLSAELNFVEAMELAADLYSGGKIAERIYDSLKEKCPLGPMDIKGQPKLDRCCVYREIQGEFDRVLVNMPVWQAYFSALDQAGRLDYAQALLDGAYSSRNSEPAWVESNELSTLAVVMQYAETLMTRFDTNRDGRLSTPEIVSGAVPVFTGFVQKFANEAMHLELSESKAQKAFLFILAERKLPNSESLRDKWKIFQMYMTYPELSLDRRDLAEVFKLFISQLMAAKGGTEPESGAVLDLSQELGLPGLPVIEFAPPVAPKPPNVPVTAAQCAARQSP